MPRNNVLILRVRVIETTQCCTPWKYLHHVIVLEPWPGLYVIFQDDPAANHMDTITFADQSQILCKPIYLLYFVGLL
jgi:hypothetical protein